MDKNADCFKRSLFSRNRRLATELWGDELDRQRYGVLRDLTNRFGFSIERAELRLLNGNWYVTHAGLLRLACQHRCSSIRVRPVGEYCHPEVNRWVFEAVVHKASRSRSFVGYGDADPSNVSPLVRGAEMRVAETRAVNRALRKAYGIGLCSVEELGYLSSPLESSSRTGTVSAHSNGNGSNGHFRLRDRLCLLIRQHQLDATLVKRYAADFCGTPQLRDANRERVESFINHIAEWAAKNRAGLVCKLNSYAQAEEVRP